MENSIITSFSKLVYCYHINILSGRKIYFKQNISYFSTKFFLKLKLHMLHIWQSDSLQCMYKCYLHSEIDLTNLGVKGEDRILVASQQQKWRKVLWDKVQPSHVEKGRKRSFLGQRQRHNNERCLTRVFTNNLCNS